VTTTPDGSGWTLHASSASFDLEYEVVDTASGDVVLRQKTTLTCGAAEPPERAPADPAPPLEATPAPRFRPGARVRLRPSIASRSESKAYLPRDRWTAGEVVEALEDGTYRVRFHTGYGLLDEEIVPAARLSPDDPEAIANGVTSPVAAAADGACRWGRGRKGCRWNPLGPALWLTFMGSAAIAGTATAYAYALKPDGPKELLTAGVIGTALSPFFIAGAGVFWAEYAKGTSRPTPRPVAVVPALTLSGRGGALAIAGTF
jgi:hypothetical protein